jgi:hypothetical protein
MGAERVPGGCNSIVHYNRHHGDNIRDLSGSAQAKD